MKGGTSTVRFPSNWGRWKEGEGQGDDKRGVAECVGTQCMATPH